MKPKTIVVLVGLLLVCTVFLVVRYWPRPAEKPKEPEIKKVFAADPNGAKGLTIVWGDGRKAVFARKDGAWRMTEPVDAPAESSAVGQVVGEMRSPRYSRVYPANDKDITDALTGLDSPLWTVALTDDDGADFTLLIGRAVPAVGGGSSETYVRRKGDERTFVVAQNFANVFRRSPQQYRDKTVLSLVKDDIARVKLEGRRSYELRKTTDGWSIDQPVSAPADATKVGGILDAFASLSTEEFLDEKSVSPSLLGLEKGKETLLLHVWMKVPLPPATSSAPTTTSAPAPEGKSYALAFGTTRGDSVYARFVDQPGVFKLRSSLLETLQPELNDLRDKKVLRVSASEVDRIELTLKDEPADLRKEAGDWRMTKPFAGKANAETVRKLLDKADSLNACRFPEEAMPESVTGMDKPQARITLHMTGKGQTVTLLVGAGAMAAGETYVKSASNPATVVVKTPELEPLLAEPANYWDPQVLKFSPSAEVRRLTLQRADGVAYCLEPNAGACVLTEPVKAPADANAFAKIVQAAENVVATKIVALAPDLPRKFAEANDSIHLTVTAEVEPPPPPTPATTQAATQPGTQPTTQSATQPGTLPATASAPVTKPATGPATQGAATSAPTSTPATGPASQAASQPVRPKITETYRLSVVKIDEKVYGWQEGRDPTAVGELSAGVYDALAAELRDRTLVTMKPSEVEGVKVALGEEKLELRQEGGTWRSESHRRAKIDGPKVQTYLEDLRQAQAEKFVSHSSADWARFGLESPALVIELTGAKGASARIVVSKTGPEKTKDRYAGLGGAAGVVVLSGQTYDRMAKALKDFEK